MLLLSTSTQVILRPITPYLIPGLLATPLIVHLARALPSVEQETRLVALGRGVHDVFVVAVLQE